jgi:hypothetical protein
MSNELTFIFCLAGTLALLGLMVVLTIGRRRDY